MGHRVLFRELLYACKKVGVQFIRLDDLARDLLRYRDQIPVMDQLMAEIDGRSGLVAVQPTS